MEKNGNLILRRFKLGLCMFCFKKGAEHDFYSITVISRYCCKQCSETVTIEQIAESLKWEPRIIYNKALNQILNIKC